MGDMYGESSRPATTSAAMGEGSSSTTATGAFRDIERQTVAENQDQHDRQADTDGQVAPVAQQLADFLAGQGDQARPESSHLSDHFPVRFEPADPVSPFRLSITSVPVFAHSWPGFLAGCVVLCLLCSTIPIKASSMFSSLSFSAGLHRVPPAACQAPAACRHPGSRCGRSTRPLP